MPIAREGRFWLTHDLAHTTCLGIESDNVDGCVGEIIDRGYRGVFGFHGFGFHGTDLDFLARIPDTEAVWFWDVKLASIDGLYSLKRLRHFGIHPKRPPIDFSRFPDLELAVWFHDKRDAGVSGLRKLRKLGVWRYKSPDGTLAGIEIPASVAELGLNWTNATSLHGLPSLPNLRRLEIARCRNLRDLGDLAAIAPNLEHLVVSSSGRFTADALRARIHEFPRLRHAYAGGTLVKGDNRGP